MFPGFDALRDIDLVRPRARLRNVAYDVAVTAMTEPPGIDSEVEAPTRREEEQTPDDVAADDAAPRRRWPWVLLGFFVVLIVGGGLGGWLFVQNLPGFAGDRAIAGAKEHGFDLGFQELDLEGVLPWDDRPAQVILRGVRVKSFAVADVDIDVKEIRGTLVDLDLVSVEVVEPKVSAPSLPALFAFEDALRSGPSKDLPITATKVRLRVSEVAEGLPLAVVSQADKVTSKGGELVVEGLTLQPDIPFVSLGMAPVAVKLERADDRVWVRPVDLSAARLGVDRAGKRGFLELEGLTPESMPKWLPVDLPGKKISGKLDLTLSGPDALKGSFDATVTGYVPPHPRELQGILFGDATKVSGKFRMEGLVVTLDEMAVKAGSLELKGTGQLGILDGKVRLDLKGAVPCAELAASAIGAHVGGAASIIAGRLARGRLTGTVETRVTVEADVRDLERAKVAPSAFVHCSVAI